MYVRILPVATYGLESMAMSNERIMLGVSLSMWPDKTMTDQTQHR